MSENFNEKRYSYTSEEKTEIKKWCESRGHKQYLSIETFAEKCLGSKAYVDNLVKEGKLNICYFENIDGTFVDTYKYPFENFENKKVSFATFEKMLGITGQTRRNWNKLGWFEQEPDDTIDLSKYPIEKILEKKNGKQGEEPKQGELF